MWCKQQQGCLQFRDGLTIQNLNKKSPDRTLYRKISIRFCKISNCGTASLLRGWHGRGVRLRLDRPLDARTASWQRQRPGSHTARVVPNLGTTEIAIAGWQASATDFRKHQKPHHTDRNRKHPLIHQPALSYETAAPDGGRLELKTPRGNARSPPPSLRRSPGTA
ncbi:MAG: hypothetical protein C5S49_06010 [Candidatus Methanogaster sp.]|nr:MAG: hypothetical protein C5S49_06010 [ANME-2 cluster archaeon]